MDLYIEEPRVLDNRPAAASRLAAELQLALCDQPSILSPSIRAPFASAFTTWP
ncbi:MAG: hypothetical protein QJR02_02100 [Sinobacteraceae bacterium]|nr:hypothetical protein [Nevskiaceae bacterium]